MGHKLHDSIFKKHGDYLSREQLLSYFRGELDPAEKHQVEAYLVDNDFDFEALEGFDEVKDLQHKLSETDKRIDHLLKKTAPVRSMRYYYLAAGIAALLAMGFFVLKPVLDNDKELLSENHEMVPVTEKTEPSQPNVQEEESVAREQTGLKNGTEWKTALNKDRAKAKASESEKDMVARDAEKSDKDLTVMAGTGNDAAEMDEVAEQPMDIAGVSREEELSQGYLDPSNALSEDESFDARTDNLTFTLSDSISGPVGDVLTTQPKAAAPDEELTNMTYDYKHTKLSRKKLLAGNNKRKESAAAESVVLEDRAPEKARNIPYMLNIKGVDYLVVDYSTVYETPVERPENGVAAEYRNLEDKSKKEAQSDEQVQEVPYEAFLKQAMTARVEKRYDDAAAAFANILTQFPGDQNAAFYGGLSYMEAGQYQKAINYFDKVLNSTNPTFFPDARWFKALCLDQNGQKKEAKELYTRIAADGDFYQERALKKLKEEHH